MRAEPVLLPSFRECGVVCLVLLCPSRLSPGEQWKGEFVVRYHECYWDPPVFDRDGAQPLPKLITQRDDADDRWARGWGEWGGRADGFQQVLCVRRGRGEGWGGWVCLQCRGVFW